MPQGEIVSACPRVSFPSAIDEAQTLILNRHRGTADRSSIAGPLIGLENLPPGMDIRIRRQTRHNMPSRVNSGSVYCRWCWRKSFRGKKLCTPATNSVGT